LSTQLARHAAITGFGGLGMVVRKKNSVADKNNQQPILVLMYSVTGGTMNSIHFKPLRCLTCLALGAALCGAPLPGSSATTFDFSHLTGASPTDFRPEGTENIDYWNCTGGDFCSSNLNRGKLGGALHFFIGPIRVWVKGYYQTSNTTQQVTVVQDHEPSYDPTRQIGAGLGVYHVTGDNNDDNVAIHEKLVLTFDQPVAISAVNLRTEAHTNTWPGNRSFLLNGETTPLVASLTGLNLRGTEFTFEYGGNQPDQFYLAGLVVSAIPEGQTYGMLLFGLAGLGLLQRSRHHIAPKA
jgi:hypothetical protein